MDEGFATMSASYETGLATNDDVPAIVAMQDVNLHENGGGLSVRQSADWFRRTMSEMPIVVARREGQQEQAETACYGFANKVEPVDVTISA